MKHIRILSANQSNLVTTTLFFIPLIIVLYCSCNEEAVLKKESKPEATLQQLQTVYGKTIQRTIIYKAFLQEAEKNKLSSIAKLFRALLRSEEIHSQNNLILMQKHDIKPAATKAENIIVGTWRQTLKMALSMEEFAVNSLYPTLIKMADCEKCVEAVKQFRAVQDAERKHAELLRYALTQGKEMPLLTYKVCPCCGYLQTTEEITECPACKNGIDKFEMI
ncbi:MAG: rubrerythrin family protein [Ignavibacteriales bacterium]|nr:rubrerythrin family protein [Ignavibacteriales bacterium]